MEGLEISEIEFSIVYSDKRLRIDSEYFKKLFLENAKLLSKKNKISKHVEREIKNINGLTLTKGINYLEISQINNTNGLDYEAKDVPFTSVPSRATYILRHLDVVVSTVRPNRNAVALIWKPNRLIGTSGLTVLRSINVLPEFLFVFCKTSYFINSILRENTATMYPAVSSNDVLDVHLSVQSEPFQKKIKELVNKAQKCLLSSENNHRESKEIISEKIKVSCDKHSENINIKSFGESFGSSGRLDAEFYQKKYDNLENKIRETSSYDSLGNISKLISRGKQPLYKEEDEKGNILPVLNSKHIRENKIKLDDRRVASISDCNLFIEENDVLINGTGVGTIGRTAPYLYSTPSIPDNHVTIIRGKKISSVYLSVYLNTIAGQLQVEKYFKGSSGQIELYPDDISNFLIWIAPKEVQKEIEEMILSAFELENQSNHFLEVAKRAVEIAIEEDEKVALEWITEQTKEQLSF